MKEFDAEKVHEAVSEIIQIVEHYHLNPNESLSVMGNALGLLIANVELIYPEEAPKRKDVLAAVSEAADGTANQFNEYLTAKGEA